MCARCRDRLVRGGRVIDVKTRGAATILIGAIIAAALVAALTPLAMPSLLSAFWQTR